MEKVNRELLMREISSKLHYGVKAKVFGWDEEKGEVEVALRVYSVDTDGYVYFVPNDFDVDYLSVENCILYLRPMSSMTEEEKSELWFLLSEGRTNIELNSNGQLTTRDDIKLGFNYPFLCPEASGQYVDWLNEHHFDYRGLIEKGLALEAPEGMYKKGE